MRSLVPREGRHLGDPVFHSGRAPTTGILKTTGKESIGKGQRLCVVRVSVYAYEGRPSRGPASAFMRGKLVFSTESSATGGSLQVVERLGTCGAAGRRIRPVSLSPSRASG